MVMVMLLLVCVCVGLGVYLSVRTILSHSVMIKALPGTPYHTHSQSTSQVDRNYSAMQPALHTSHTGSHSLTHTQTHIHARYSFPVLCLSSLWFLILFFIFTSCCVFLRCFSCSSFQLKVLCLMYHRLLSPSLLLQAHLDGTLLFLLFYAHIMF